MNCQGIKTRRSGKTVDQAETIEKNCGSQCSEKHVFETGFGGFVIAGQETSQDVERDGSSFNGQVQHHQVRGRSHQAHSDGCRQQKEIGFGTLVQPFFVHEEKSSHTGCQDKKHLEKETQPVKTQHAAKNETGIRGPTKKKAQEQGDQQTDGSEHSQESASICIFFLERIKNQHQHCQCQEQDFRENGKNCSHLCTSQKCEHMLYPGLHPGNDQSWEYADSDH